MHSNGNTFGLGWWVGGVIGSSLGWPMGELGLTWGGGVVVVGAIGSSLGCPLSELGLAWGGTWVVGRGGGGKGVPSTRRLF